MQTALFVLLYCFDARTLLFLCTASPPPFRSPPNAAPLRPPPHSADPPLLQIGVSQTYEKWGLCVERMELQDLRPKATSNTATAMKKQMIAERSRRREFIVAEGDKAAMRLRSEGQKIVKANMGVAEQEATRKRSEGAAAAKVEMARAEKISLDAIAESVEAEGCSQTDFMISKRCVF